MSQTTVSRVLAGHPNVSDDTRARVLAVLAETGYAPNLAARTMRTGTTGTVGVVIGRVTNPFYPMLVEQLHRLISDARRTMSVWISDGDAADSGEQAALHAVRERAVDGVIYTTVTAESRSLEAALAQRAPILLLNRTIEGLPCDSVTTDGRAGAAAAVAHLVALGHERLGLVSGPNTVSTARDREAGFAAAVRAAGLEATADLRIRGDFTHAAGADGLDRLLAAASGPPTAVFCVNDVIAFGVLDRARDLGLAVPGDLSVVGYDDTEMAAWPAFGLTTVRQPVAEMAAAGLQRLLARIADPSLAPLHLRLEATLVARSSTGVAPPGPPRR